MIRQVPSVIERRTSNLVMFACELQRFLLEGNEQRAVDARKEITSTLEQIDRWMPGPESTAGANLRSES